MLLASGIVLVLYKEPHPSINIPFYFENLVFCLIQLHTKWMKWEFFFFFFAPKERDFLANQKYVDNMKKQSDLFQISISRQFIFVLCTFPSQILTDLCELLTRLSSSIYFILGGSISKRVMCCQYYFTFVFVTAIDWHILECIMMEKQRNEISSCLMHF